MIQISIIIPSYNDKRIVRTVKSILSQNFDRDKYEIIVMDGGSDKIFFEDTLEYLRDKCNLVIHEKDNGIFDALNKGIDLANGDLIFMIGSDDFLISNDVFSIAYKNFMENNYELIVFELFYVNQNNEIERYWSMPSHLHSIPAHFQLPHFSTFMSRNLIDDTRFNLESYISADYGFFKNLLKKNRKNLIINSPVVCMTSGGQSSKNFLNIFKGNIQSLKEFGANPFYIIKFLLHKLYTKSKHHFSMKINNKKREEFQDKINLYLDTIN